MHIDYSLYKIEVDGKFGMTITIIRVRVTAQIAI